MNLSAIIIVVAYFGVVMFLSLYKSRHAAAHTTAYWAAGRNVGCVLNGLAQFSALASAASFLGFVGLGYRSGWVFTTLVFGVASAVAFALSSFFVAAPLRTFSERHGKFTLTSFFEARFGKHAATLSSAFVLLVFPLYLVPQVMGAGLAGEHILGIGYETTVIVCGVSILGYVALGGMISVTWMDATNAAMMVLLMVGLALVAIVVFGGPAALAAAATASNGDFLRWNAALPAWSHVGLSVAVMLTILCSPHILMKLHTARTVADGRLSLAFSGALSLVFHLLGYFGVVGAALIIAPQLTNIDTAYLKVMEALLPTLLQGLAVAALLGAIVSTSDAVLLAVGAEFGQNIYARFVNRTATDRERIRAARWAMIVIGLVAISLALLRLQTIGVIVATVIGGIGAAFAVPLFAGLWWRGASHRGGVGAMIGGFGTYVVALFGFRGLLPPFTEILFALVAALVGLVLGTLSERGRPAATAPS